jgi:hypothetical protein
MQCGMAIQQFGVLVLVLRVQGAAAGGRAAHSGAGSGSGDVSWDAWGGPWGARRVPQPHMQLCGYGGRLRADACARARLAPSQVAQLPEP